MIEQLFTKRECEKALMGFESLTKQALPPKLREEQKMKWQLDAMNEADGSGPSFSKYVDAFLKSEVTGSPKPHPIAGQGQGQGQAEVGHLQLAGQG